MRRKEMKQLLEERIERISLLETRIDTMEQLVDGYRAREQSIIDTLHAAKETATTTVEDGKMRAETMLSEAKRHADSALADAQMQATAMVEEANRRAEELLSSARNESERMLESAESTKREYEQMVVTFNTMLEQNAVEAAQSASRYAEFIKGRIITTPQGTAGEEAAYQPETGAQDKTLPDPEGDPARLMQNIYQLQNRPLPEGVQPEQNTQADTPVKETTPVESLFEADEPRPRHARTSEPELDDTKQADEGFMFDQTVAEPENPMQYRETFDSQINEEPEPFSENAWGSEAHQSPSEPQAEFTTAFDTDYPQTDFSLMPDPECAVNGTEPEKAAEPAQTEPEPFSEEAWNHAAESPSEPQAEFAPAFTMPDEAPATTESDFNVEETADFAANYEANFEAAVAATDDEPQEWEPEDEPDMNEVPSVGDLLPDGNQTSDDDISLDELLDEIIKAGE